jgi:hypothetical protein
MISSSDSVVFDGNYSGRFIVAEKSAYKQKNFDFLSTILAELKT